MNYFIDMGKHLTMRDEGDSSRKKAIKITQRMSK